MSGESEQNQQGETEGKVLASVLAARLLSTNALQVTGELLVLRPSPAQEDYEGVWPFHYLAAKKRVEFLKASVHVDGPAVKSALDYLREHTS